MNHVRHILQEHTGIVVLTISLVVMFVVLYLLRNIILPFLIGLVLAYILLPVVSWVERRFPKRWKRPTAKRILAIVIVFILLVAILGTAGFYVITAMIDSIVSIIEDAPEYLSTAFETIRDWFQAFRDWLPITVGQELGDSVAGLGENLGSILQDLFMSAISQIPGTFSYIMGFATLPIFLFYLLKDREHLRDGFYSGIPQNASRHVRNLAGIIDEVLGGYIRAQLATGFFVGVLALIGLLILDAPFAFGLATIAGVSELVPILGPWIGGAIAVLVVLAIQPGLAIWVIILFFAIQIIENTLLTPRIQGHFLHINPAIAVVLIIIGAAIAGLWGLILTLPLVATLVALYKYVLRTAREEDFQVLDMSKP